ncbi:MAG: ATP phosphoribosyltransferase regulatory subunit [Firmicutes bacterium]|nr:ATP phosphoribosyltransferase regulatory subunit [Bacillota bacterium]
MAVNTTQLKKHERMIFDLRAMYAQYGYTQFKIRKFEEFELYVRNKDFLDSVNVITFTDTNGKLMALKPDVTLSVVKNSKDEAGTVQKVYYNENIYRVSKRSHMFEELMQVGIECIGDIDDYNIFEVLMLAAKTLREISPKAILDVSNLDIVSAILSDYHVTDSTRIEMLACLGDKNIHTLRRICQENDVTPGGIELLEKLTRIYGRPETVLPKLRKLLQSGALEEPALGQTLQAVDDLERILDTFTDKKLRDMIRLDFSVVSDVNYYNGIVFNGFIRGIPDCVISGGQYDRLMQKMKRKSGAIGFGVYMDRLERLLEETAEYDIEILLLYDETAKITQLNDTIRNLTHEGHTVVAQRKIPDKLKYKRLMRLTDGEVTEIETDA